MCVCALHRSELQHRDAIAAWLECELRHTSVVGVRAAMLRDSHKSAEPWRLKQLKDKLNKLKESTSGRDFNDLSEVLRDGSLHGCDEDVKGIIRSWAEKGWVHLLQLLRESAWWPEDGNIIALNVAAEAGTLIELLMTFELPLSTHPVVAQTFEEEAISAIVATPLSMPSPPPSGAKPNPDKETQTPQSVATVSTQICGDELDGGNGAKDGGLIKRNAKGSMLCVLAGLTLPHPFAPAARDPPPGTPRVCAPRAPPQAAPPPRPRPPRLSPFGPSPRPLRSSHGLRRATHPGPPAARPALRPPVPAFPCGGTPKALRRQGWPRAPASKLRAWDAMRIPALRLEGRFW